MVEVVVPSFRLTAFRPSTPRGVSAPCGHTGCLSFPRAFVVSFLIFAASLLFSANETFAGSGGDISPSVVEEPVSDPGFEGDFLVCCTSPL